MSSLIVISEKPAPESLSYTTLLKATKAPRRTLTRFGPAGRLRGCELLEFFVRLLACCAIRVHAQH